MYISEANAALSVAAIALLIAAWALISRPDSNSEANQTKSSLVIDQCYRTDSCGSAKLLDASLIERRGEERLLKATLQRGKILDPDNDNFPVEWG